ncbi:hypothetical protein [Thermotoga sp. KOL6]|uniref:hypothetical protein n=1 Tax=Thermotoga sp. KOL6 TaxID=126741 RepID=UPI000C75C541|nr:hypothetical protein [Thermotoga sp. KOL6]PLV59852.1 hypothetical protein AS005_00700 [Thermotoga sp. KOL6]
MKGMIVLFLILATMVTGQMVMYQLVVAEMTDSKSQDVILKELTLYTEKFNEKTFSYTNNSFELKLFPFSLKISLPEIKKYYRTLFKPWIITLLGRNSTMRMGRDELSPTQEIITTQEIFLSLTPKRINDEGDVFSVIQVRLNGTQLNTTLWLSQEDFQPIFYANFKSNEGEKKVVVFSRALVVKSPPEEKIFVAGDLSGLEEFLPKQEGREKNNITLSSKPEIEIGVWLNKDIHLFLSSSEGLLLESKIFGEPMRAGVIFWRFQRWGVGFSDYSKIGKLLLSSGVYALFNYENFSGAFFWGRGDLLLENFSISMSFKSHWTLKEINSEIGLRVGYKLYSWLNIFVGVTYNVLQNTVFFGIELEF